MIRGFLFATLVTITLPASAATIDFEDTTGVATVLPVASNGFLFTGAGLEFPIALNSLQNGDGISLVFCPGCSITFQQNAGLAFDLLNADLLNSSAGALTVTGNLAGGGTVQTLIPSETDFNFRNYSFDSSWSNLTSVVIQSDGGGVGAGIDNIAVNVVPIPAAAWLFASGLGLLGWLNRRQAG